MLPSLSRREAAATHPQNVTQIGTKARRITNLALCGLDRGPDRPRTARLTLALPKTALLDQAPGYARRAAHVLAAPGAATGGDSPTSWPFRHPVSQAVVAMPGEILVNWPSDIASLRLIRVMSPRSYVQDCGVLRPDHNHTRRCSGAGRAEVQSLAPRRPHARQARDPASLPSTPGSRSCARTTPGSSSSTGLQVRAAMRTARLVPP